jgi:hypothetical protein
MFESTVLAFLTPTFEEESTEGGSSLMIKRTGYTFETSSASEEKAIRRTRVEGFKRLGAEG